MRGARLVPASMDLSVMRNQAGGMKSVGRGEGRGRGVEVEVVVEGEVGGGVSVLLSVAKGDWLVDGRRSRSRQ